LNTTIPSEFVGFVRETGVRAFDRLAERAKELETPLRNFVRSWSRLSEIEKLALFDELIEAAKLPPAAEPKPAPRRAVKRYDPEEVATTLPKKPRAKPKATSKKK
jgi:hypothetical protein